ncbi:MAG: O-antigen ligase family protein [Patescibacteria group bacterium]|nr:O-antigen ligase family protein [Patescibacteria group bacterium]
MKWFLFLILASLPTYQIRLRIFGLPTTLLEIMILILFAYWFINKIKDQKSNIKITSQNCKRNNWFWLILLWLLVSLIAVFFSPDQWLALGHWRAYFLEPILLLIIFLDLIKTKKDLNFVFFFLSFSALYISLWAIGQKIFGGGMLSLEAWQYPLKPIWRATGPFPQSNFLGLYLSPLILLFLGQFLEGLKDKKFPPSIYYFFISVLSILAIIFARSEGAILGIVVGLIFYFLIILRKNQKLIFILVLLSTFYFLLFFSPWQSYLWPKITFQDLSGQLRLNIWQGVFKLLKERPIFGAGLRGYQKLIPLYQKPLTLPTGEIISKETHPYPHNLFLALWSELGIFGLITFLMIILNFFQIGFQKLFEIWNLEMGNLKSRQHNKLLIASILSAVIVILIHSLVDTSYFKNDLAILFWIIIGSLLVTKNLDFSAKSEKI